MFSAMPFSAIGTGTNPFIIEVDTSKAGSANDAFQFTGAVGDYDVVAKQSGVIVQTFSNLSGQETITLSNGTGIYILEVTPKAINGFNRIRFNNTGDHEKLTKIKQWGNVLWSDFFRSFRLCINLTEITSSIAPNLSNVTNIGLMFQQIPNFNPDFSNWDVSNITDAQRFLRNSSNSNANVSGWDISNFTDMYEMLSYTNLSTANLDACYQNWSQLSLQSNVPFSAGTTKFSAAAQAGRDILVNTYNWTITDGGVV